MNQSQELAELAIREAKQTIDYIAVQYPIEYFINKVTQQEIDGLLNWDESKQSYFIESLMLGLPVFNIVVNNNGDEFDPIGSEVEVIDGKQRLYTAINFVNGRVRLSNLKVLNSLNSFKFEDLMLSRQRKFKRITVKAIAVNPKSDLSIFTRY